MRVIGVFLFTLLFKVVVYAAENTGGGNGDLPQEPVNPLMQMLFPLMICLLIFYFILIRPQQKQRQRHENQINQLKKGDRIITAGGIYGSIVGMKDNVAVIKIAENVKIEIQQSSISHIIGKEEKGSSGS